MRIELENHTANSPLLKLAAWLWVLVCLGCLVRAYLSPAKQTVYPIYAQAAQSWSAGTDCYDGQQIKPPEERYRYSPTATLLFVPFSICANDVGGVLWRLFSVVAYLAAFVWLVRVLRNDVPWFRAAPGGRETSLALMLMLLLPLSLPSINNGQANILLLALLLAATAGAADKRWNLTAFCLAGASLLKLYPVAVAFLFLVLYPRQLIVRFLLALIIGTSLPFLVQDAAYVYQQYAAFWDALGSDHPGVRSLAYDYRDFLLLARWLNLPVPLSLYHALQIVAGAGLAAFCLFAKIQGRQQTRLLLDLLAVGCCWMVLFGPATESSTYVLLAPSLVFAAAEHLQPGGSGWARWLIGVSVTLLLTSFAACWFPNGRHWIYPLQPIAALIFLTERLLKGMLDPALVASKLGCTDPDATTMNDPPGRSPCPRPKLVCRN